MLLKDAKFASFERGGAVEKRLCASVPCAYCCSSAQEIHQLTAECGKGAFGCFDRSQGRGERENCLLSRSVILYLQRPLCCVSPITVPVWFGFWF